MPNKKTLRVFHSVRFRTKNRTAKHRKLHSNFTCAGVEEHDKPKATKTVATFWTQNHLT